MSSPDSNSSERTVTDPDTPVRTRNQDANGGNSLPTYLTTISHHNEPVIVSDIVEDENEEGDGDESDDDGDHRRDFLDALDDVMSERYGHHSFHNDNDDIEDVAGDSEANGIVSEPIELTRRAENIETKWPKPPENWVDPEPNSKKGEVEFRTVDNPGKWSSYAFTPKFETREVTRGSGKNQKKEKKNFYVGHSLPTGCMVVPRKKVRGQDVYERKNGGWEFFYDGWKSKNPTNRNGAGKFNYSEMFPKNQKGMLDVEVLKKLGLRKKTIDEKDCLFFFSCYYLFVILLNQVLMMIPE